MKLLHMATYLFMVIGGVNWGLIGLGMMMGGADWNVVHMLLGSWPMLESLVYLLVGVSAVYDMAMHKKNCKVCGGKGK
jgi:uncharacterized membrane protein YuzA (DUF378 family)